MHALYVWWSEHTKPSHKLEISPTRQSKRYSSRHANLSRQRQTEADRDRQKQTETDRSRLRQTHADRDRQKQTETYRIWQTEANSYIKYNSQVIWQQFSQNPKHIYTRLVKKLRITRISFFVLSTFFMLTMSSMPRKRTIAPKIRSRSWPNNQSLFSSSWLTKINVILKHWKNKSINVTNKQLSCNWNFTCI